MDVVIVIIIALAGALAPDSAKEFTIDMRGEYMVFEKQAENIWLSKMASADGEIEKAINLKFTIDGLNIGLGQNGVLRTHDVSKFLGVDSIEELKILSKFKLGNSTAQIQRQKKGFVLKLGKRPEFKISWK